MAEILSGGLNWGSTQQAIVTMDKEGHPLSCCNPVTGECLGGGGGSSDFSTAEVTIIESTERTTDLGFTLINVLQHYPDYGNNYYEIGSVYKSNIAGVYTVVLYQGRSYFYTNNQSDVVATSGDISWDDSISGYVITGDCSITVKGEEGI